MSIPLSSIATNDRLIWAETRSGKFTVKSAYALALEEQQWGIAQTAWSTERYGRQFGT